LAGAGAARAEAVRATVRRHAEREVRIDIEAALGVEFETGVGWTL